MLHSHLVVIITPIIWLNSPQSISICSFNTQILHVFNIKLFSKSVNFITLLGYID